MVSFNEKFYKSLSLREFPYRLSKIEKRIYDLIKHGESHGKSGALRSLKHKRNCVRRLMYEKLKDWIENPPNVPELTYSDIMEMEEKQKQKMETR